MHTSCKGYKAIILLNCLSVVVICMKMALSGDVGPWVSCNSDHAITRIKLAWFGLKYDTGHEG